MIIKKTQRLVKEYPSQTVLFSLILTIFIGACFLSLPACKKTSMHFIDIIFVATSLTTVTGLTTVPFQNFTLYGQFIMLILMQIGGLGLMTMSLFIMSLFGNFGLYTQVLASEILSIQSFKDTRRILFFLVRFTLTCEFIGALVTFFIIRHDYTLSQALFYSIFHAVSAFCNVGISLFHQGNLAYHTNPLMLITTTLLILFGSLGFVTWHEFAKLTQHITCNKHLHKISWHTQLVLKTFFATTLLTFILFWILERHHTLAHLTSMQTFLHLCLISVSTKSAGYIPIAMNLVQPATILLLTCIAFIGAAPSSTGGGIKTSAFAIFLTVVRATIKGRYHAEINGRKIATDQVYKAMALIALSCSWIFNILFFLLITEQHQDFLPLFVEAVSAFSNNGISLGCTKSLSLIGKVFLITTMIIGRIGALTLIIGMRKSTEQALYSYPEEKVILG